MFAVPGQVQGRGQETGLYQPLLSVARDCRDSICQADVRNAE